MDRIETFCADSSSPSASSGVNKIGDVQKLFETFDGKVKGVIDATKMNLQRRFGVEELSARFRVGYQTSEQQKLLYAGHILDFCGSLVSARSSLTVSLLILYEHNLVLYKHNSKHTGLSIRKRRTLLDLHPQRRAVWSADMLQTCLKNLGVTNDSGTQTQELRYDTTMPTLRIKKVGAVQVLSRTLESHESEPVSTPKQITTLLTCSRCLL